VRLHNDVWWLLGSTLAAVCVAPLLVHGDAELTARRTAASQKIEQLTPAERQQLDNNLKRFEKLTPAEQAKFRELHEKVEQNPKVNEALGVFSEWWRSISAPSHAELFREADPRKRVAIVDSLQEGIDDDRVRRVYFGGGFPWEWGRRGVNLRIQQEEFYRIMDAMEAIAFETYAVRDSMDQINALPVHSVQRTLALLKALHEKHHTFDTLVSDSAKKNRLIESVSNEYLKSLLKARLGERAQPGDGWSVRLALSTAMLREIYLDNLKQQPGEKELLEELNSLPIEQRMDLYAYAADEGRDLLREKVREGGKAAFTPVKDFFQISFGFKPGDGGPERGRIRFEKPGGPDGEPGRNAKPQEMKTP
jgi:hypothetical protein